jgi:hypothetical protein
MYAQKQNIDGNEHNIWEGNLHLGFCSTLKRVE